MERQPKKEKPAFNQLADWMNYEHPKRDKIDDLVKNLQSNNFDTHYIDQWRAFFGSTGEDEKQQAEEVKKYLEAKLNRKILIDLGSNRGSPPVKVEVGTFIEVDKFFDSQRPLNPTESFSDQTFRGLRMLKVQADMLDFASRVPSGSTNVMINGIDWFIIKDKKYLAALAEELARIIPPGGVVFGLESDVLKMLDPQKFKEVQFSFGTMKETVQGQISSTHVFERLA